MPVKSEFYLVESERSKEYENDLRKVSLRATEKEEYLFVWLDRNNEVKVLQFIFDERFLEWKKEKGFNEGTTNRLNPSAPLGVGIHKGARTIEAQSSGTILMQGKSILNQAEIPAPFGDLIRKILA